MVVIHPRRGRCLVGRRAATPAFDERERAEAGGLVHVPAPRPRRPFVDRRRRFADQPHAVPEESRVDVARRLAHPSPERVVLVAHRFASRGHRDQPMFGVVLVARDEPAALAAALLHEIARGVVGEVAVALHDQAVTFGQAVSLAQQVACGIVDELLARRAFDGHEPLGGIVDIARRALPQVVDRLDRPRRASGGRSGAPSRRAC